MFRLKLARLDRPTVGALRRLQIARWQPRPSLQRRNHRRCRGATQCRERPRCLLPRLQIPDCRRRGRRPGPGRRRLCRAATCLLRVAHGSVSLTNRRVPRANRQSAMCAASCCNRNGCAPNFEALMSGGARGRQANLTSSLCHGYSE